jgi:hypothetical protein
MNATISPESGESSTLWRDLLKARQAYDSARKRFLDARDDRVSALRSALRSPDRWLALSICAALSMEEKMAMFPEWVYLASWSHGAIEIPRNIILSLPRKWVLERIEAEVESYLVRGGPDEFRRFMELYAELDRDALVKLASRAKKHPDPEVREAGDDFLERANRTDDSTSEAMDTWYGK